MRRLALLPVLAMVVVPAAAQQAPSLALELNALQPSDSGCRVSFLASNGLGADLGKAVFEVALFGAGGAIDRLVSLDFKAMPAGKTRVMQFDIPGLDCGAVTRALVNDVTQCEGDGLDPAACLEALVVTSPSGVPFGI